MKTILAIFLCALAGGINAQSNFSAVMVNSNGVVQRPANFFSANNLSTNVSDPINTIRRVEINPQQWSVITNTGKMTVGYGTIVSESFTTSSGQHGVAYYGANVGGHAFLNIDSGGGINIDNGTGFIVQGNLGGSRTGVIKRFVLRGVSATSEYAETGTNGLTRAGWAVETRLNGTTNQVRLVVHSSSGPAASAWEDVAVNKDIVSIWSYRDATNTYVHAVSSFGEKFSTQPTVTFNSVAGGTAGNADLGFAISMNVVSGTSSAPYLDVASIYETKNAKP